MTSSLTMQERAAFYRAAILGLRALDDRDPTARRLSVDAEARWMQFAGALGAGDRLDILIRDAAGTWGAAFSPAECFGLFGLADDEPFGPDWDGIEDQSAKRLLAELDGTVSLAKIASVLSITLAPIAIQSLTPATKIVIAGGAALAAAIKLFAENRALSWTDQVVVVANKAAFRQLAGLAAVLIGARGRTVIVRPGPDAVSAMRAAGLAHIDVVVISPDAEPEAAEFAGTLGGK